MSINHLRNIRALMESAKNFEVSRKVDTYEYESLEKMILDDQIKYSEVIELFTDKIYSAWFYERNFADAKTALKNNTTLKHETLKTGLIIKKDYEKIVDPKKMIYPA